MLLEGHQLGRYHLLRQIGSGGMGTIFLADDTSMSRQVAVKIVRTGDDMPHTQETAQRMLRSFQREMRAIVHLDHPHILPVFDFGQETLAEATYSYLVMLYRPEGSLADWLRQSPRAARLSLKDLAELLNQAAQALQHAHSRNIIHQDVKPSNFLVRIDASQPEALPDLLLADFGIARFSTTTTAQSQSHNVRGTPMFMSPEQWDGKPVPASDQYALGIMAFRILTGHYPFQGTMGQIMRQHYMIQPTAPSQFNPQLSSSLDEVLLRALAKEPEKRFPDMLTFAAALSQAVDTSEKPQDTLIAINAFEEGASSSHNVSADQHAFASMKSLDEALPQAQADEKHIVPSETKERVASAHSFVATDSSTFIPSLKATSPNLPPTPPSLSDMGNDDPTFLSPHRSSIIYDEAERISVPVTAQLPPATLAISTRILEQPLAPTARRRFSRLQKGLVLALLVLIILAGSGILLYRGVIAPGGNKANTQAGVLTQIFHTSSGTVTVTITVTPTYATGQSSPPTKGNTPVPGSTAPTGTGPQTTPTTSGAPAGPISTQAPTATSAPVVQPTTAPTSAPPTPTPVPPPPPTPTPLPGCSFSSWSLNLRSQSDGGTVYHATNYCSHVVSLRLTQAPRYTTDLQICFGSSNCTGWNSAPSSNVGVFIEFDSGVSTGAGFTVNARCHGGATCPAAYTVYGQARY